MKPKMLQATVAAMFPLAERRSVTGLAAGHTQSRSQTGAPRWRAGTLLLALLIPLAAQAQVNSGSNGSDGAFNPTTNTVINMADHPTGIYQYTSVNISNGVTVTFIPNANNTPVVWLVQSNCFIAGIVSVAGETTGCNSPANPIGAASGPGGWAGGSAGSYPSPGQGPGGGESCVTNYGAGGSFGSQGQSPGIWAAASAVYGNVFLFPLLGGSGGGSGGGNGGGNGGAFGGGGGGGAILIAASGSIQLSGVIDAAGGSQHCYSGSGSGGGVRLVTSSFSGAGSINASGGFSNSGSRGGIGGNGRIRIEHCKTHSLARFRA